LVQLETDTVEASFAYLSNTVFPFIEDFDGDDIFGKIDIGSFKKRYKLRSENLDGYKLVYVLNEL
jgi:hypothetical protein